MAGYAGSPPETFFQLTAGIKLEASFIATGIHGDKRAIRYLPPISGKATGTVSAVRISAFRLMAHRKSIRYLVRFCRFSTRYQPIGFTELSIRYRPK